MLFSFANYKKNYLNNSFDVLSSNSVSYTAVITAGIPIDKKNYPIS